MPTLTPCLWLDLEAEEAATFYTSIFPNSRILQTSYYNDAGPRPAGTVLTVEFELDGKPFTALNGGPEFTPNEAVSFQISVDDQTEIDYYTDRLTADGGEEGPCGWVKDRFGVSWQVVPTPMIELLMDPDPGRSSRAMTAMMTMKRIDLTAIRAAADATG